MMTSGFRSASLHSLPSELLEYLTFQENKFGLSNQDLANLAMSGKAIGQAIAQPLLWQRLQFSAQRAFKTLWIEEPQFIDRLLRDANALLWDRKTVLINFLIDHFYRYAQTDPLLPRLIQRTDGGIARVESLKEVLQTHIDGIKNLALRQKLMDRLQLRLTPPREQYQVIRKIYTALRQATSSNAGNQKAENLMLVLDSLSTPMQWSRDIIRGTLANLMHQSKFITAGRPLQEFFRRLLDYLSPVMHPKEWPDWGILLLNQTRSIKSSANRCQTIIYLFKRLTPLIPEADRYRVFQSVLAQVPSFAESALRYKLLDSVGKFFLPGLPASERPIAYEELLKCHAPQMPIILASQSAENHANVCAKLINQEIDSYQHLLTNAFPHVPYNETCFKTFLAILRYASEHHDKQAQFIFLKALTEKIGFQLPQQYRYRAIQEVLSVAEFWQDPRSKTLLLKELNAIRLSEAINPDEQKTLGEDFSTFAGKHHISFYR